jgi:predicted chitinase
MALPMLLGGAARGLVRGGGRAAASKIMGRKKTMKAGDIKPQTAIVPSPRQEKPGGALVKSPTAAITKAMAPVQQVSTGAAKDDYLGIIHEKVLTIEKIVAGVYKAEQDNLKAKKQTEKDDARKNQEQKLETQDKKPDKKKPKLADLPKLGVFGWLKRFIGSILMGLFLIKMIDFAGLLPGIIKTIDGITTFLAKWGGKIVGALITFVDFGIKAYDFTIGAIEKGIGPLFGKHSDKVLGLIETAIFLTTAIAGSMAAEAMMGGGGGGPTPTTGIRGAAGQAGRVARGGTTAAAARRYAARFGRDAAVQRFGPEAVKSLGGKFGRSAITNFGRDAAVKVLGKRGAAKAIKTAAGILKPLVKNIPLIGGVTEFILSWISGDPVGKAAFKGIGAGLGTWIGGALGSLIPIPGVGTAIGMFLGGTGGSALGEVIYDAMFKGKKPEPTTESVDNFYSEFQEGGEVEGRPQKRIKRGIDIKKKKPERRRVPKPTKEKIKLTPKNVNDGKQKKENDRAWWDFLGWAGTGGSSESKELGPGGKALGEKVTKVGNQLGDNDYFGPILRLTSKVILDQEVTARDYTNVGKGINLLLDDGMRKGAIGMMAYNEGGAVENLPQLDVTDWVKKNFETGLSDSLKKKYVNFGSTSGPGSPQGQYDPATGEYMGSGAPGTPFSGSMKGAQIGEQHLLDAMKKYKYTGDPAVLMAIVKGESNFQATEEKMYVSAERAYKIFGSRFRDVSHAQQLINAGKKAFYDHVYQPKYVSMNEKSDDGYRYIGRGHIQLTGRSNYRDIGKIIGRDLEGDPLQILNNPTVSAEAAVGFMIRAQQYGQGVNDIESALKAVGGSQTSWPAKRKYYQEYKKKIESGQVGQNTPTAPDVQQKAWWDPAGVFTDKSGQTSDASDEQIKVGGSNIVNIGKDLISKGFSVAEHPDFTKTPTSSGGTYTPGKGYVSNVHQGAGHYDGRAIDVTDWRGSMEDSKARYRSVLTSLQDNPAIKMLIHDSWGAMYGGPGTKQGPGAHSHPEHMHIEVKDKGGFIGKGLFANLGGTEFVTDADSTAALKQVAPGLQMALNQASDKSGIESVLKQYASYEQGAGQTVMVQQDEGGQEVMQGGYGAMPSTTKTPPLVIDTSNPFEFLEYQG